MKDSKSCKTCERDGYCIDQSLMGHCKRYTNGTWAPTKWMQKENPISHRHQTCGNCEHFWETDHVNDTVYGRCRKGVELHVKFNRRPRECTDWSHRDGDDPVKKEIKCLKCGRTGEYISESSIDGMSKYFCIICDKWFGGDMNNCGNCKHLKVDDFKGACVGCTTYPKDTPFKHWEAAKSCQSCKYKGNGWIHPCDSCCPTTYSNWEPKESPDKCKTCKHRKPPHRGCDKCREADDGVYPGWESKDPSLGLDEGTCQNCKYWHENPGQGTKHPDHRIGTCHKKGCNTFESTAGWYCRKCEPKDPMKLCLNCKYYEVNTAVEPCKTCWIDKKTRDEWEPKMKEGGFEPGDLLIPKTDLCGFSHATGDSINYMTATYPRGEITTTKIRGNVVLDDKAKESLKEQLIPPFVTDFSTKIKVIEPLNDMERSIMRTDVESEFSIQVKEIKQEFDDRLKDLVDDITDFKREWINREMKRRNLNG